MLPAPRASHWLAGKSQLSVTNPPNFCWFWGCCSNSRFYMWYRSRIKRKICNGRKFVNSLQLLPGEPKLSSAQQTVLCSPAGKLRAYWLLWREYHNPPSSLFSESQNWKSHVRSLVKSWSSIPKKRGPKLLCEKCHKISCVLKIWTPKTGFIKSCNLVSHQSSYPPSQSGVSC